VTNRIQVGGGQTLVLANSANGLTVPQLTGNGAIILPGGTYAIDGIFAAAGETLAIHYGSEAFVIPPLSGTGKVTFVGTGALTVNQPAYQQPYEQKGDDFRQCFQFVGDKYSSLE